MEKGDTLKSVSFKSLNSDTFLCLSPQKTVSTGSPSWGSYSEPFVVVDYSWVVIVCLPVDPLSVHPSTRRENHSQLVIFWRMLCCILVLYIRLLSLPTLRKDTCSPPLFFYQQSLVEIPNKDAMTSISVENPWSWSVHQLKGETDESQLPLSTNRQRLSSTLSL